jgi:transposase
MTTRRHFTAEFKAQVALEAIRGERTLAELATNHQLHPNLILTWKRQAIEKMARIFTRQAGPGDHLDAKTEIARLHAKIGHLVVERDTLAKACRDRNQCEEA